MGTYYLKSDLQNVGYLFETILIPQHLRCGNSMPKLTVEISFSTLQIFYIYKHHPQVFSHNNKHIEHISPEGKF